MKLKNMATPTKLHLMDPPELATLLEDKAVNKVLLLDSRSCFEHNNGKIRRSSHIVSSSMIKRRLQTDKVKLLELLHLSADSVTDISRVIVYDQSSSDLAALCPDSFATLVLSKLANHFPSVFLLKGGFSKFLALYPELCVQSEQKTVGAPCPSVEPAESIRTCGPTQIFPHVYLGSEKDALSLDTIKARKISHVLNVSMTCPKADFIQESNFMRIAVNDTCTDKLLCHFIKAFKFLDDVKRSNGCALIHCMAGVSRSPTLAVAYVMKCNRMPYDEAYRFVKDRRPAISPNLNFLGQLLEFDKCQKEHRTVPTYPSERTEEKYNSSGPCKRQCKRLAEIRSLSSSKLCLDIQTAVKNGCKATSDNGKDDLSPSSVISKLSIT